MNTIAPQLKVTPDGGGDDTAWRMEYRATYDQLVAAFGEPVRDDKLGAHWNLMSPDGEIITICDQKPDTEPEVNELWGISAKPGVDVNKYFPCTAPGHLTREMLTAQLMWTRQLILDETMPTHDPHWTFSDDGWDYLNSALRLSAVMMEMDHDVEKWQELLNEGLRDYACDGICPELWMTNPLALREDEA